MSRTTANLGPAWVWLGSQICALRKAKDLTQRDLGKISGFDYSHICNIETGNRKLTIEGADKLSEALGQPRAWLQFLALRAEIGARELLEIAEVAIGVGVPEVDSDLQEAWSRLSSKSREQLIRYARYLALEGDEQ